MKCELSIARIMAADDSKVVRIDACDGSKLLGRIELDLETFAACLMGLGKVPAEFTTERRGHSSSAIQKDKP